METKPRKIKLNDAYNTVIYLQPGDDAAQVKKFYEDKLKDVYTLREDSPNSFNETTIADNPF